jgi:hypothetical protein
MAEVGPGPNTRFSQWVHSSHLQQRPLAQAPRLAIRFQFQIRDVGEGDAHGGFLLRQEGAAEVERLRAEFQADAVQRLTQAGRAAAVAEQWLGANRSGGRNLVIVKQQ